MNAFLQLFQSVTAKLESIGLEYMVVGSVASTIYGEPRLTRDIDLVLEIPLDKLAAFETLFPPPEFYIPPREILNDEIINRRQFNLLHIASGLKIDCMVRKNSPHGRAEFARRRQHQILPEVWAWIASPEDVIIKKMVFYGERGSEKHLRDIKSILAFTKIDHSYLQLWIKSLKIEQEWARVRAY